MLHAISVVFRLFDHLEFKTEMSEQYIRFKTRRISNFFCSSRSSSLNGLQFHVCVFVLDKDVGPVLDAMIQEDEFLVPKPNTDKAQ